MRKTLLLVAAALCSAPASFAQYLYGTSTAAGVNPCLVRFNPANNSFVTMLKSFNYFQLSSAKDTTHKIIYFTAPNLSSASQSPDTLIIFRLADTTFTTKSLPKGGLPYPQFDNGRLISISDKGMAAYDLTTNQYTITDSAVKVSGVHSADFDRPGRRYIFMKRSTTSNIPDTLYVYTIATHNLTKHVMGVSSTSNEMRYSPVSDKVLFLGIPPNTADFGIYSFKLSTQAFALEAPINNNGGTLVNCATFDETNNRYFCVRTTNTSGTGFNIIEYRVSTGTLVDHNTGIPGLGFPQYFDNSYIPAPPHPSGIGHVTDEPFRMYPNPASRQLNVQIDLNRQSAALAICDLTGKTIYTNERAAEKNSIDISKLAGGRYMLRISYKDKTYSRLFSKD